MPVQFGNSFNTIRKSLSKVIKQTRDPNDRESMSDTELKKEKLAYETEPLFFQRKKDFDRLSKDSPGTKFNRSQIDSIIYARNTGVSMGLLSPEDGDMFVATQLREARSDFGVNRYTPEGDAQFISINQGKTREAAGRLYGVGPDYKSEKQTVQRLDYYPPDRTIERGAEVLPDPKIGLSDKRFSPYSSDDMSAEDYQDNSKLALLAFLSKKNKGESSKKIVKDWNGDGVNKLLNADAKKHVEEVLENREALLDSRNDGLRNYISERLNDDSSIYKVKPKK